MLINKNNYSTFFYIFITVHSLIWIIIPAVTNHNLPLDTVEALAWGSNLDWGFNKHPPMSAFLVEVFFQIFGTQDWAYYLLSQICVISSFFIVYKFSEDFFENKVFCLLSVLLLEGIYFFNFTTPEFNVNICLMPFWALSVFYLWRGIKNNNLIDWVLLGLFSGFAFLSKYLFIYLGLAIDVVIIYMIFTKRIDLKCFSSLIPLIIVLIPHLLWLMENNYITISYGLHRTGSDEFYLINHIKHPIIFLIKQIGILIPFVVLFLFINNSLKTKVEFNDKKLLFLLAINLIPFDLVFLTSMIMGVKIRTMWMTPFYLFLGVLVLYIYQHKINLNKLKKFTIVFGLIFLLSPFIYAFISITKTDKRTDYKGEIEAKKALFFYKNQNEIKGDIAFIKGDEWFAGNLSYHLKERPVWIYQNKDIHLCNKKLECVKYK
mgnify:CR=1 FL=1|tara:strand:- start:263 stop:1558 length:1296 start_codon:yes stop_codon:yes gene_type:complete